LYKKNQTSKYLGMEGLRKKRKTQSWSIRSVGFPCQPFAARSLFRPHLRPYRDKREGHRRHSTISNALRRGNSRAQISRRPPTMPAPADTAAALPLSLDLEDFKVDPAPHPSSVSLPLCPPARLDSGGLAAMVVSPRVRVRGGCRRTFRSTRCSGALWMSCSRSTAGSTTPRQRRRRRPCSGPRRPSSPQSTS
jgi:hypothetical protein